MRAVLQGVAAADRAALLAAAGIDPDLAGSNLAGSDLAGTPVPVVSTEQFARLVRAVWDHLDDELMGHWPVPSRRGTFATMGLLAVHCADLRTALTRATAFYHLFPGGPRFRLLVGEEQTRLELEPGPGVFLTESLLMIWHRFASWLVRAPIVPLAVELAYPAPAHRGEYPELFGAPVVFGQPCSALVLETAALHASVQRDERALAGFLHSSPADLLARREHGTSRTAAVRRVVGEDLAATGLLPTLPHVAARLGYSPASLRRHLAAERTSYSTVCDALRRDLATASITDAHEPLDELAVRLGFSEASALHRAFRRWTGHTPGSYLAAQQQ